MKKKKRNIKKIIMDLLDIEIVQHIVRAFILLLPIIAWIFASIISNNIID